MPRRRFSCPGLGDTRVQPAEKVVIFPVAPIQNVLFGVLNAFGMGKRELG
jgi:hypothetical protein